MKSGCFSICLTLTSSVTGMTLQVNTKWHVGWADVTDNEYGRIVQPVASAKTTVLLTLNRLDTYTSLKFINLRSKMKETADQLLNGYLIVPTRYIVSMQVKCKFWLILLLSCFFIVALGLIEHFTVAVLTKPLAQIARPTFPSTWISDSASHVLNQTPLIGMSRNSSFSCCI